MTNHRLILPVLAVTLGALALTPAPALALPEGRVYEMVSPVYKGGYGARTINAVAPDGESVAFLSLGAFAGAPSISAAGTYIARRGVSGWSSASLLPPAGMAPVGFVEGFSTDLGSVLFQGELGPSAGIASDASPEKEFLVHRTGMSDTEANWEVAGMVLETLEKGPFILPHSDTSADLSHIVFGGPPPLLSAAVGTFGQLYDLARSQSCGSLSEAVCREDPATGASLRLVGLKPGGEAVIDPYCEVELGAASGEASTFNAIAGDGRVIFFTTNANTSLHDTTECDATYPTSNPANPAILYVRVAGEKTLKVSAPLASGCATSAPCHSAAQARAEFQGASADGSRVFFTTAQPLVSEDTDETNDLYMATIGCPAGEGEVCQAAGEAANAEVKSLVRVSRDPHAGQVAGVQGVVAVAPDGSRVYFVARGVLSGEPGPEGRVAVKGAENLYVYERDARYPEGHTAFVADLCSGKGLSGEAELPSCPLGGAGDSELWSGSFHDEQIAGSDGRFLLFLSYGRLAGSDTDTARDVYRYDALTGALDRVSIGEAGHDANGNNDSFDAAIHETRTNGRTSEQAGLGSRAISEDGSRVVFTTSEPLSVDAVNGLPNVYEWHREPSEAGEGRVSLVSSGNSVERVEDVVITPSGRDVFFVTAQGLVPQDTDEAPDVYDARIGGGFPLPTAEREPCAGDACQGALTNPAALLVPGSVPQAPGGNFAAPAPAKAAVKPKAKSCRKGYVKKKRRCVKARKAKRASRTRGARR
jgi:hypothetical protein